MKDPDNRKYSRERKRPLLLQREARISEGRFIDRSYEDDPALERGERIDIGRMSVFGGKSVGDVQGTRSNSDPERSH